MSLSLNDYVKMICLLCVLVSEVFLYSVSHEAQSLFSSTSFLSGLYVISRMQAHQADYSFCCYYTIMSFTHLLTLENQIFEARVQICLFHCIVCLIVTRIVDLFLWEYFEFGMINSIRNQNCQNLLHKLAFMIIHLFRFEIIFQRQKSRMQRINVLISRMASFECPFMPPRFKGMIFLV